MGCQHPAFFFGALDGWGLQPDGARHEHRGNLAGQAQLRGRRQCAVEQLVVQLLHRRRLPLVVHAPAQVELRSVCPRGRGPGRHQCRHRHRHRLPGLDRPCVGHQRRRGGPVRRLGWLVVVGVLPLPRARVARGRPANPPGHLPHQLPRLAPGRGLAQQTRHGEHVRSTGAIVASCRLRLVRGHRGDVVALRCPSGLFGAKIHVAQKYSGVPGHDHLAGEHPESSALGCRARGLLPGAERCLHEG
mmetsp:Transcript_2575/g.7652  ORF Transcript_2575/g.7652 Transcript_2575/m.7652 type:complete len:245 (-) Transcript_2575:1541-2275(-)